MSGRIGLRLALAAAVRLRTFWQQRQPRYWTSFWDTEPTAGARRLYLPLSARKW